MLGCIKKHKWHFFLLALPRSRPGEHRFFHDINKGLFPKKIESFL